MMKLKKCPPPKRLAFFAGVVVITQERLGCIKIVEIIFSLIRYSVRLLVVLLAQDPLPGVGAALLSTKEDFRGHYGRTFFLDMSPLFS